MSTNLGGSNRMLSTHQVAERLGVSQKVIQTCWKSWGLPVHRIGRALKVRERDLEMPRSAREWLPPGHLCWRVLEVVEGLDLSAFEDGYRADGQGGGAYAPAVLVALIFY